MDDHVRFPGTAQALREPIGQPPLDIYDRVGDNDEMLHALQPGDDRQADHAVMQLLAADREEIEAALQFTQDIAIRTSGRIFFSQYIQLLRKVGFFCQLNFANNMNNAPGDIRNCVLLLRRLARVLEAVRPTNYSMYNTICTNTDPCHCTNENHKHFSPYHFIRKLGEDLCSTKQQTDDSQDRSDDKGLLVRDDPEMYATNLELLAHMLPSMSI